jgi:hypothetical protein
VPNMKLKRPVIPDSPLTTGQGPQGCVCTGQGEMRMVGVGVGQAIAPVSLSCF